MIDIPKTRSFKEIFKIRHVSAQKFLSINNEEHFKFVRFVGTGCRYAYVESNEPRLRDFLFDLLPFMRSRKVTTIYATPLQGLAADVLDKIQRREFPWGPPSPPKPIDDNFQTMLKDSDEVVYNRDGLIVRYVYSLLRTAIHENIAEIRIIPLEEVLQISFRHNGEFKVVATDERSFCESIIKRLKTMAGIFADNSNSIFGRIGVSMNGHGSNFNIEILTAAGGDGASITLQPNGNGHG